MFGSQLKSREFSVGCEMGQTPCPLKTRRGALSGTGPVRSLVKGPPRGGPQNPSPWSGFLPPRERWPASLALAQQNVAPEAAEGPRIRVVLRFF